MTHTADTPRFPRLRAAESFMDRLMPHLFWVTGLYFIADAIFLERVTVAIAQEPRGALLIHGYLLFRAGRWAVGYMQQADDAK